MEQKLFPQTTVYKIARKFPSKEAKYRQNVLRAYLDQTAAILNEKNVSINQRKSAIICMIKGLSSGIQSDINTECITSEDQNINYYMIDSFPIRSHCTNCYKQFETIPQTDLDIPVALQSAPIISPIWNKGRMSQAFMFIGADVGAPFRHQENNHFDLEYIKPLGFFWNGNGLHSTNTGILKGEGTLKTSYMIDLSDRFKHFEFDGTFYIHKACNTPVIKPIDYRLGVIFEIGRILEKNSIQLW